MQDLLTEAVTIPSLLHQNDILFRDQVEPDPFKLAEMFRSFIDVLERLAMRQEVLSLASDLPPQWPNGRDPGNDFSMFPNMDVSFLFPNITVANGLTHLWAFRIVCLSELEKLARYLPQSVRQSAQIPIPDTMGLEQIQAQIYCSSKSILVGMEYLLMDEMKLYGPASTFFPLWVVYRSVKGRKSRNEIEQSVERIVARLVEKGLKSAPSHVMADCGD